MQGEVVSQSSVNRTPDLTPDSGSNQIRQLSYLSEKS